MIFTGVLTAFFARQLGTKHPETTMGRAIGAIWIAVGLALFVLCLSLALSGHAEQHTFLAVIESMLGLANAASGIILKWRAQFLCAAMWLAAAAATCFVSNDQGSIVFLTAIFFGQIVFGVYMMILEAQERKSQARKSGAAHA
jgi:multisubunit Na+/H+ antiporter MnhB subunit